MSRGPIVLSFSTAAIRLLEMCRAEPQNQGEAWPLSRTTRHNIKTHCFNDSRCFLKPHTNLHSLANSIVSPKLMQRDEIRAIAISENSWIMLLCERLSGYIWWMNASRPGFETSSSSEIIKIPGPKKYFGETTLRSLVVSPALPAFHVRMVVDRSLIVKAKLRFVNVYTSKGTELWRSGQTICTAFIYSHLARATNHKPIRRHNNNNNNN